MYSNPRPAGARVRLLAVHTTEGVQKVGDLRAFFDRTDAQGSSHATADVTGALWGPAQGFVPYERAAWTLRNGNPISENIELCAWARWSRGEWLAKPALLDACARWLADRAKARGIPLVKLSPADVRTGKSGVIGHVDWTVGMSDGTHTDPGVGFPWDVVLDKARALAGQGPAPAPAPAGNPGRIAWSLPAGHYYGNIAGPASSHGGINAAERSAVRNIQQWLIYKGCVPGVQPAAWATSGWADGKWEKATDDAMVRWHARFYPNQPQPSQCWGDDYARLAQP